MSVKNNSTIAEKTAQLSEMIAWFNSDEFELEKALDKFTQAQNLAAEIEKELQSLKNTVTVVKQNFAEAE
jgi:exonuclease VII small subunit